MFYPDEDRMMTMKNNVGVETITIALEVEPGSISMTTLPTSLLQQWLRGVVITDSDAMLANEVGCLVGNSSQVVGVADFRNVRIGLKVFSNLTLLILD